MNTDAHITSRRLGKVCDVPEVCGSGLSQVPSLDMMLMTGERSVTGNDPNCSDVQMRRLYVALHTDVSRNRVIFATVNKSRQTFDLYMHVLFCFFFFIWFNKMKSRNARPTHKAQNLRKCFFFFFNLVNI